MCTIMVDGKHQIMKCICSPSPTLPKSDVEGNWQTKIEPEKRKLNLIGKRQTLKMKWGKGGGWEKRPVHTLVPGQVPLWRQRAPPHSWLRQ